MHKKVSRNSAEVLVGPTIVHCVRAPSVGVRMAAYVSCVDSPVHSTTARSDAWHWRAASVADGHHVGTSLGWLRQGSSGDSMPKVIAASAKLESCHAAYAAHSVTKSIAMCESDCLLGETK